MEFSVNLPRLIHYAKMMLLNARIEIFLTQISICSTKLISLSYIEVKQSCIWFIFKIDFHQKLFFSILLHLNYSTRENLILLTFICLKVDVLQRSLIHLVSSLKKKLNFIYFLNIAQLTRVIRFNRLQPKPPFCLKMLSFKKNLLFIEFIFYPIIHLI